MEQQFADADLVETPDQRAQRDPSETAKERSEIERERERESVFLRFSF